MLVCLFVCLFVYMLRLQKTQPLEVKKAKDDAAVLKQTMLRLRKCMTDEQRVLASNLCKRYFRRTVDQKYRQASFEYLNQEEVCSVRSYGCFWMLRGFA